MSMRPRVLGRLAAALLLAVLALAGSAYAYWDLVLHRLVTVVPGALYRSAAMPPSALVATTRDLGIKTVVDLRDPDGAVPEEREALARAVAAEETALAAAGVGYVHIPSRQEPSEEQLTAFLAVMDDPVRRPVLVHCEHGIGRSVLYGAISLIEYADRSNEEALAHAYWSSGMGSFEPEAGKGAIIMNYARRIH